MIYALLRPEEMIVALRTVALLLIDVLTTFHFPDGDAILEGALAIRDALAKLRARAREVG